MHLNIDTSDPREIDDLLACLRKRVIRTVTILFKGASFTTEGDIMLNVKATEVPGGGTYKFDFTDAKKNRAPVDGLPTISASDPTIVDQVGPVTDNGDGTFSAPYHVTDKVGSSQVLINADVDLGAGVNNVTFVDVVNVIPGDAVAIEGDFGTVTADPAAGAAAPGA